MKGRNSLRDAEKILTPKREVHGRNDIAVDTTGR